MTSTNVSFSNAMLKNARKNAKELGVKIPQGLVVWRESKKTYCLMEVYDNTGIVWTGSAYSASDAKAEYIFALIEIHEEINGG